MAASMWEVTRLVLGTPDDAAGIAQAHGFTIEQVTDLLPLFLDNVTTGYDEGAELPPGHPDGTDADAVARWLDGWAQQVGDGTVDVVSHGGFGAPDLDGDPFETGGPDADAPDLPAVDVHDAGPDEAVTFGLGGADGDGSDGAPDGTHPAPDGVTDTVTVGWPGAADGCAVGPAGCAGAFGSRAVAVVEAVTGIVTRYRRNARRTRRAADRRSIGARFHEPCGRPVAPMAPLLRGRAAPRWSRDRG